MMVRQNKERRRLKVVILIGFSCTGKSTAVNELQLDPAFKHVDFIDSDKLIAKDYDHHIYKIFLELVEGKNRSKADQFISDQECKFLQEWTPTATTIIAAGPILATRSPLFDDFVTRVNGKCLWLSITPKVAAERLLKRQNELAEKEFDVATHRNFGSWNVPHLVQFNDGAGKYEMITDEAKRIATTKVIVENFERAYKEFAPREKFFVEREDRRTALVTRLKDLVGK